MTDGHGLSTAQMVSDLAADVRTLVRQEIALARAEIREELSKLVIAALIGGVAAASLAAGGLWLLLAATRAVAAMFGWPLGAAYAVLGLALAIGGAIFAVVARSQLRAIKLLPRTRETLMHARP